MSQDQLPPFPGLRREAFEFLRGLDANNDREWFNPRKRLFEDEVQWPIRCLVTDVSRRLAPTGIPLRADPRRSLFRIHRDTRFSNNKDPYKTHQGAVLTPTGDHRAPGGVYVHVEPGQSFLASGFWRPEPALVRAWRGRMLAEPDHFLAAIRALESAGLELSRDDMLKRPPRGFENPGDADIEPWLLFKSFVVVRNVVDEQLMNPGFADVMVRFATDSLPLLRFGWELEGRVD